MLKSGVLFKKLTNFTVEYLQNHEYSEHEIFWINFKHVRDHLSAIAEMGITNNGELKTLLIFI